MAAARNTPVAASMAVRDVLTGPARAATVLAVTPAAVHLSVPADVPLSVPDTGPEPAGSERAGVDPSGPGAVPHVVSLLASDAAALPLGLRLTLPSAAAPFAGIAAGAPALVGSGRVCLRGLDLVVGRWWDPGVRRRLGPGARADAAAVRAALELLPPYPPGIGDAALDLADALAAVPRLVGLGPGLTPAGDDLLCGALAAVHGFGGDEPAAALAAAVRAHAHRTTPLSAALLRVAADGYTFRELLTLLAALAAGTDVTRPLATLQGVGATSGTELARGALLVLHGLDEGREAA